MNSFSRSTILLVFLFFGSRSFSQETSIEYCNKISSDSIKNYLFTLASDTMEGRETGRPGQKKASYFLASKYRSWKLNPVGTDKSTTELFNDKKNNPAITHFFQNHPISIRNNSAKNFTVGGESFLFGRDFYYSDGNSDTTFTNKKFVFVNVKKDEDGSVIYYSSKYSGKNILLFGAKNDDIDVLTFATEPLFIKEEKNKFIPPAIVLIITTEEKIQKLFSDNRRTNQYAHSIRILISEKMANKFFKPGKYKALTDKIKSNGKPVFKKISLDSVASVQLVENTNQLSGQNVLAFIPGTDKYEETLVISSHYDHLGKKDTLIYYGADDNGSGTSAVLELARIFKLAEKEGHCPRRNILFMNVSGEEKRLLGSSWYVSNPVFPLANTIADLNIDMVGRIDHEHDSTGNKNYVYIIGSDKMSTELHNINEEQNKKVTNLALNYKYNTNDDPNQYYRRSDHYNFVKNGIPVIFYFNGVHVDYHRPTDTPDKIDVELLTKRAKLVFLTAWELVNRDNRITIDKPFEKDK